MNHFIDDMTHMTEGEKFIKYWWLWTIIVLLSLAAAFFISRRR